MSKLVVIELEELKQIIKDTIVNTFAESTPEEFITITEAQKMLKCGGQKVKTLVEKGLVKGNHLGKVSKQSIYKFLNVDMQKHLGNSLKH